MHLPTPASLYSPPHIPRSEAFAEDLLDHDSQPRERRHTPRWLAWTRFLPVLVALLGVAFAVLPPG